MKLLQILYSKIIGIIKQSTIQKVNKGKKITTEKKLPKEDYQIETFNQYLWGPTFILSRKSQPAED